MSSSSPAAPAPDTLAEELASDMHRRWQAGERPRTEEYLCRHPELWDHPEAAAELIYEEVCLHQEYGEGSASSEVLRRFPQWAEQLRVLLNCHRALEADRRGPEFPAPGETLGDFRLLCELGRGSQGRVFLATQTLLADRPVVVKLSPLGGGEHLALARLQHTHIVPLYSAATDPARRLRMLCLPYFGGATLAALLKALADLPPDRRTGADMLAALAQAPAPPGPPAPGPQGLARLSLVEVVCRVGVCLADALQHAHERDLLHLDLKPSNILLAADGTPMLLDFHLAHGPIASGAPAPAWLGGTPAYLSPEQAAAMRAVHDGAPVPEAVDGRSDLYALGVVLYEALAGQLPPGPATRSLIRAANVSERAPVSTRSRSRLGGAAVARSLRHCNPAVSVGLADLVARCLEPRPCDRYPNAGALAADLRRHLAHQPLRGVANRDPRERWQKWRRRRPHILTVLGFLLLAAAGAVLGVAQTGRQLDKSRAALAEGREEFRQQHYPEAARVLRHGLELANDLPFGVGPGRELTAELRRAERAWAIRELHQTAEQVRGLYGTDGLSLGTVQAVEHRCRRVWEQRKRITGALGLDLPEDLREQARNDLLELAVLGANLRVAAAPAQQKPAARRAGLQVLAETEEALGPNPILYQERARIAEHLGLAERARQAREQLAQSRPRTAWEHYAVGCGHLRAGHLERAAAELKEAVAREPNDLWANFYRGKCATRRGRHEEALVSFAVCVALAPHSAACLHSRGMAQEALGHSEEALADYDRALQIEPGQAATLLSRGLLQARAGTSDAARADLQDALAHGADPATAHYGLALAHLTGGDRKAALRSLDDALRHNPAHEQARLLRQTLQK
jgi:eukaryotic-like serine/threonine-protein kinase